jgi:hypothetical protein
MYPWMVASWFVVVGTLAAVLYIACRTARVRRLPSLFIILGCAFLTLTILRLNLEYGAPHGGDVRITAPPDQTEVKGDQLTLRGSVRPPSARVTVVVHAQSDPVWWVQEVVNPQQTVGDVGFWTIRAHLGTQTAGRNETFYVVALASANNVFSDLITKRYLRQGQRYRNLPPWSESSILTLRRVE